MAAKIRLNNFRFSIYIDGDGTVTLTDLPHELLDVVAALDPAYRGDAVCHVSPPAHTPSSHQGHASTGGPLSDGKGDGHSN
jgi:hypothetical protein